MIQIKFLIDRILNKPIKLVLIRIVSKRSKILINNPNNRKENIGVGSISIFLKRRNQVIAKRKKKLWINFGKMSIKA